MSFTTDPPRLSEQLAGAGLLRQGLIAARHEGPTEQQLRALERGIAAGLVAAAVVAPVAAASTATGAASWLSATATKVVLVLVGGATLAGGAAVISHALARRSDHRSSTPVTETASPRRNVIATPRLETPAEVPAPMPEVQTAPSPVEVGPYPPLPVRRSPVAGRGASFARVDRKADPREHADTPLPPQPAPATSRLDDETTLLDRANASLPDRPRQALALALEHARRFADSEIAEERELIAIRALIGLGQAEQARDRTKRFLRAYPQSAYRARLAQLVPGLAD
jgi:hypothetical protein